MVASVLNPVNWIRKKVNFEDRDTNADGIKTGTGWVRPDDGLLVGDLNGSGLIDSGRELFGTDTLKANNTLAANGFDALKELDSNGDDFITVLDTAYAELKVWRDANQDGISQAAEMQSFGTLGISSIGVNGTATSPQAGQVIAGNRVDLRGVCITLAELWRADRDGLQGDFLQPIARSGQEKQRSRPPKAARSQTAGGFADLPFAPPSRKTA